MPWPFDQLLGQSFKFYEAQRSGAITTDDPSYRIDWRGDQLLDDGSMAEPPVDMVGGYYEAGNRLKVTLATSYFLSRLAWSCLAHHDLYEGLQYEGESMLYWCKREVEWASEWLLKTHVDAGGAVSTAPSWQAGDKLVLMVGKKPDDFWCYQRAEHLPMDKSKTDNPPCPDEVAPGEAEGWPCQASARAVTFADGGEQPASEVAASASAAAAAAAALLTKTSSIETGLFEGTNKLAWPRDLMAYSAATLDFATSHPGTAMWEEQISETYPVEDSSSHVLFAYAMQAYVNTVDAKIPGQVGSSAMSKATQMFNARWSHLAGEQALVSDWSSPDFDSALLLLMASGDLRAAGGNANTLLQRYITSHLDVNGAHGVEASPLGMRTQEAVAWAWLRVPTASAFIAATYAGLPGVEPRTRQELHCYARSQLGYAIGDTGQSYVVGFPFPGERKRTPRGVSHVHHRDSMCSLREKQFVDRAAGDVGEACLATQGPMLAEGCFREHFFNERGPGGTLINPNAEVLEGAVLGGPFGRTDTFGPSGQGLREEYHHTEVALDYNTLYTMALAATLALPGGDASMWKADCSQMVPRYPWMQALERQVAYREAAY